MHRSSMKCVIYFATFPDYLQLFVNDGEIGNTFCVIHSIPSTFVSYDTIL